jgi:hypothetical protein
MATATPLAPVAVKFGDRVRIAQLPASMVEGPRDDATLVAAIAAVVERAAGIPPAYQLLEWAASRAPTARATAQPQYRSAGTADNGNGLLQSPSARHDRWFRQPGADGARTKGGLSSPSLDNDGGDDDTHAAAAQQRHALVTASDVRELLGEARRAQETDLAPPVIHVHVVPSHAMRRADMAFALHVADAFEAQSDLLTLAASAAPLNNATMLAFRQVFGLTGTGELAADDAAALRSETGVTRDEARSAAEAIARRIANRRVALSPRRVAPAIARSVQTPTMLPLSPLVVSSSALDVDAPPVVYDLRSRTGEPAPLVERKDRSSTPATPLRPASHRRVVTPEVTTLLSPRETSGVGLSPIRPTTPRRPLRAVS